MASTYNRGQETAKKCAFIWLAVAQVVGWTLGLAVCLVLSHLGIL